MDWQELEAFRILARELHFGRTAERLHLSRGRVSQLIKTLEQRIGAPLFDRTSRRVSLTPIGKRLFADLEPHHLGIVASIARATDAARGIGGTLAVGFSSPLAGEAVLRIADDFRADHPDCEVVICEVQLSDRYGPLRAGELDLALVEFPVDEPDLVSGPAVFFDQRVLAVSTKHRLADRDSVNVEDLKGETSITIAGLPQYFLDDFIPSPSDGTRPIEVATSWQELLTLVAADRGVAVCAAQGAHYYARPTLTYLPFTDTRPVAYGLIWRSSGETAMVRAFTRTAIETTGRSTTRSAH